MDSIADAAVSQRLQIIHKPEEIRECRVFAPHGAVYSAYFTSLEWITQTVIPEVERTGANAYFTLNPVMSPAARRLHDFERSGSATGDRDILKRTRLLIDLDPKRPAGTSATDAEKRPAQALAAAISEGLASRGWPEPVLCDSGNGYHLIYRIELPNDLESRDLVRACLEALAAQAPDRVDVDRSVFNASRITTLYGTTKRKGEATPERPHRRSAILNVPESFEIVPKAKLEELAMWAPKKPAVARPEYTAPIGVRLDLREWLVKHSVPILTTRPWITPEGESVELFEIPCPFSPSDPHGGSQARVWQMKSGQLHATCHHARCVGYGWCDLRAAFDPAYKRGTVVIEKPPSSEGITIEPPEDPNGEVIL